MRDFSTATAASSTSMYLRRKEEGERGRGEGGGGGSLYIDVIDRRKMLRKETVISDNRRMWWR